MTLYQNLVAGRLGCSRTAAFATRICFSTHFPWNVELDSWLSQLSVPEKKRNSIVILSATSFELELLAALADTMVALDAPNLKSAI